MTFDRNMSSRSDGASDTTATMSDDMGGGDLVMKFDVSVREAFRGATVLLTGGTGFVGSLFLEQLLRLCDVERVYLLVRGKHNLTAEDRVNAMLDSAVFNLLWDKPEVLAKVHVVEGDVSLAGLGIPDGAERQRLLQEVNFVVHGAASVALNNPIQQTLNNNYMGTKRLLDFCSEMENLHAFTHISTAFVNIGHDSGSTVKEKIYPLMIGDEVARHDDIVLQLMRMSPEDAEDKAQQFMLHFKFPNTYCFGKHLTESLVQDMQNVNFPVCIVRPSLISSVESKPYPGYIGNLAGAAGFAMSFGLGFFEKDSAAWNGQHVTDIIPADVVTSLILAATAEVYACPYKREKPMIYHACSTTTYPATNHDLYTASQKFFTREPPPYCLLWGAYPDHPVGYVPNPWRVYYAKTVTYCKVQALSWVLGVFGKNKMARRLQKGYEAWDYANSAETDINLYFSTKNVRRLDGILCKEEKSDMKLLFTPQNSNMPEYFDLFLAGVKRLLLRAPLKRPEMSSFQYIGHRSRETAIGMDKKKAPGMQKNGELRQRCRT